MIVVPVVFMNCRFCCNCCVCSLTYWSLDYNNWFVCVVHVILISLVFGFILLSHLLYLFLLEVLLKLLFRSSSLMVLFAFHMEQCMVTHFFYILLLELTFDKCYSCVCPAFVSKKWSIDLYGLIRYLMDMVESMLLILLVITCQSLLLRMKAFRVILKGLLHQHFCRQTMLLLKLALLMMTLPLAPLL